MVVSTLAWLLPVAAMPWWWPAVFLLSQSLAGLYLAQEVEFDLEGSHKRWRIDSIETYQAPVKA